MTSSKFALIIPARLQSNRLPGKVLLKETGSYLIQHVWEQVRRFEKKGTVLIATDSVKVKEAAESFGAQVQMTRADHPSGTDRVAEAARSLDPAVDIIVNVQGDEPFICCEDIENLISTFDRDDTIDMATLARKRTDLTARDNPNIVKVVTGHSGGALYFSRSPIPFAREGTAPWLHHIGIYAYRRELLLRLSSLPPTTLEGYEKLEQLRVLEHGYRIKVILTEASYEGIDTREQYDKFVETIRKRKENKQ